MHPPPPSSGTGDAPGRRVRGGVQVRPARVECVRDLVATAVVVRLNSPLLRLPRFRSNRRDSPNTDYYRDGRDEACITPARPSPIATADEK